MLKLGQIEGRRLIIFKNRLLQVKVIVRRVESVDLHQLCSPVLVRSIQCDSLVLESAGILHLCGSLDLEYLGIADNLILISCLFFDHLVRGESRSLRRQLMHRQRHRNGIEWSGGTSAMLRT